MQSLDIYFHISQDITISCSGKNEVHLAGYFEQREEEGGFDPNELDDDEEAEMEMEDIEDDDDSEGELNVEDVSSEDEAPAPKKGNN